MNLTENDKPMRIEMDETTGVTLWAIIATLAITVGGIGGCHITEKTKQKAIETGLVEKPTGGRETIWSKP